MCYNNPCVINQNCIYNTVLFIYQILMDSYSNRPFPSFWHFWHFDISFTEEKMVKKKSFKKIFANIKMNSNYTFAFKGEKFKKIRSDKKWLLEICWKQVALYMKCIDKYLSAERLLTHDCTKCNKVEFFFFAHFVTERNKSMKTWYVV